MGVSLLTWTARLCSWLDRHPPRGAQGGAQRPHSPRLRRPRGGVCTVLTACAPCSEHVVKVGVVPPPPPSITWLRAEGRRGSRARLLWWGPNFFTKVLFGSCFVFFCPKHCNSADHLSTDDRPTRVMAIFCFTEGHFCLPGPPQTALIRWGGEVLGVREGGAGQGHTGRAPSWGAGGQQDGSRTSVGICPSLSWVTTAAMGRGVQRSKTRPHLVPRKQAACKPCALRPEVARGLCPRGRGQRHWCETETGGLRRTVCPALCLSSHRTGRGGAGRGREGGS